ncbi:MAG: TerB family tellurite resistance protein [Rhodobacteraceae bacterium]|nr:TerB family tellurite resistance protein [Paracoccaceae bacterium]
MFAKLLDRLTSKSAPLPAPEAQLALAALMVRIAKTDGDYAAVEISQIDKILAERYGLDPVAAAKLRAQAEVLEHEAPDTVRFTRAIKDAVPFEDRNSVIAAAWAVALADGSRDPDENALLRMIAPMLGINDTQSHEIRRRVTAELAAAAQNTSEQSPKS